MPCNRFVVMIAVLAVALAARAEAADRVTPWTCSAALNLYLVTHDRDYLQPTVTADRGGLHLEARYNYEDLETASVWLGYNFDAGGEVSFELTPKLGVVFGETEGIAPGYHGTLSWKTLTLYSEGEHVFDADDDENSFFYSWSELTASPWERWRAGLALQRTQVYETAREFQWGFLLGVSLWRVEVTGHVFDPDQSDPTCVIAVSAES